jgi:hypothetical protein
MNIFKPAFYALLVAASLSAIGCTTGASDEPEANREAASDRRKVTVENYSITKEGSTYALTGDIDGVRQTIYPVELEVDGVVLVSRAPKAGNDARISPQNLDGEEHTCFKCYCPRGVHPSSGQCDCVTIFCPFG